MSQCLDSTSTIVEAHCERIDSFAVMDAARWNELTGGVPFRQWEWCETWWRHYRQNRHELFLLVVRDAMGDILGVAPWYLDRSPLAGRTVRFLGSGEICSDYVSVLCRPEHTQTVVASMTEWLAGRGRLTWDLLDLDGIDEQDIAMQLLLEQLGQAGLTIEQRSEMSTWRLALPTKFDEWVQQLSKSRRERVRSMCRKLYDTGRAIPRIARSADELREAWDVVRRLHQLRRTSLGESGCFHSPRFEAFHDEIVWRYHDLGQLRLHWVTLDGAPIACEYDLTGGDIVYMYQSGIDPAQSEHRPGWLNMIGTLRYAIEEQYTGYDFMRGDEPYKSHWRAQPRTMSNVRVVANRWVPKLRDGAWHASRAARRWIKQTQGQLRHLCARGATTEANTTSGDA